MFRYHARSHSVFRLAKSDEQGSGPVLPYERTKSTVKKRAAIAMVLLLYSGKNIMVQARTGVEP